MIIYPAIDLIAGAVVRLHKGDFDQLTTYGDDPVSVAQSYADAGATWLHLVDLDGAKNPDNRQIDLIAKIISSTGLKVQTGGGIRSFADVQALVNAGASRIVIGSLAVRDPEATKAIFKAFGPEKICLAADVIWQNNGFTLRFRDGRKQAACHFSILSKPISKMGFCTRFVPILTATAP